MHRHASPAPAAAVCAAPSQPAHTAARAAHALRVQLACPPQHPPGIGDLEGSHGRQHIAIIDAVVRILGRLFQLPKLLVQARSRPRRRLHSLLCLLRVGPVALRDDRHLGLHEQAGLRRGGVSWCDDCRGRRGQELDGTRGATAESMQKGAAGGCHAACCCGFAYCLHRQSQEARNRGSKLEKGHSSASGSACCRCRRSCLTQVCTPLPTAPRAHSPLPGLHAFQGIRQFAR